MERIPLKDYVQAVGQQQAARVFDVSQYAISKAVNSGRKIFVYQSGERVFAVEERQFPVKAKNQMIAE